MRGCGGAGWQLSQAHQPVTAGLHPDGLIKRRRARPAVLGCPALGQERRRPPYAPRTGAVAAQPRRSGCWARSRGRRGRGVAMERWQEQVAAGVRLGCGALSPRKGKPCFWCTHQVWLRPEQGLRRAARRDKFVVALRHEHTRCRCSSRQAHSAGSAGDGRSLCWQQAAPREPKRVCCEEA